MGIFGSLKTKAMSVLWKKQLKHLPPEQQVMMKRAIEEHPELFQNIAKEIKEKTKAGQNETYASLQVMQKYQMQLQQAMMGGQPIPKQKIIYKQR